MAFLNFYLTFLNSLNNFWIPNTIVIYFWDLRKKLGGGENTGDLCRNKRQNFMLIVCL